MAGMPDLSERRLRAEHAVTRVLAEAPSLDVAMSSILRGLCETCGWAWGGFWSPDESGLALRCEHLWHAPGSRAGAFDEKSRSIRLENGTGLPGRVWSSQEP